MAELTDEEYEAANERGRIEFETKPHAKSARFDRASGIVTLELYNGCTFSFPARQLQGLENASDDDLETVELIGVGYGIHWEPLDADFTVPGLMDGRFGTPTFMAPLRARLRTMLEQAIGGHRDAA
ncbi:DUF2442 domain-containing protein [Sphingomonas koreensis]|nr:DUF2442 domain-containing protein [Sphingomonas koreensis]